MRAITTGILLVPHKTLGRGITVRTHHREFRLFNIDTKK
jgi:hypothetical protein